MTLSDNLNIDTPGQTITSWDLKVVEDFIKELIEIDPQPSQEHMKEKIKELAGDAFCVEDAE